MTVQDIKRGHWRVVDGDGLKNLMEDFFDTPVSVEDDGWHLVEYGALKPLKVKMNSKNELEVITIADPDVANDVASESIRRYNKFLEAATGFNSKQRSKRLQKKAKEGKL
ncbi:MAG: DUF5611 family protein [Thermoplasmata archaeon]|jgi:hypothetical protein|nr:DUF5611 family protein [Thermoplasmata archaeon]